MFLKTITTLALGLLLVNPTTAAVFADGDNHLGHNNLAIRHRALRNHLDDTTAPSALAARDLTSDQQAGLDAQNAGRRAKSVPLLTWDAQLAADAQGWADHLAQIDSMTHSSSDQRPGEGENLAYFGGDGADSAPYRSAAELWMREARNYHGQVIPQGDFASYGHYSQSVWRDTTKVGMAWAKAESGNVFVVGRYAQQGNIVGQKPY